MTLILMENEPAGGAAGGPFPPIICFFTMALNPMVVSHSLPIFYDIIFVYDNPDLTYKAGFRILNSHAKATTHWLKCGACHHNEKGMKGTRITD